MPDELELVRMLFEVDPTPERQSSRTAIRERLFAEIAAFTPSGHSLGSSSRRRSHRDRRRRFGIAVGASIGLLTAGGGIAAAAGVLPLPWQDQKAGISFINSSDPASVPGSKVQLTLLGPDSTVWRVVSDVVDNGPTNFETCATLSIHGPEEGHSPVAITNFGGGCSFGSAEPGGTISASQERQMTPSINFMGWRAPSGTTFAIVWGQTPPGYATASLRDNTGTAATTEPVINNYYVLHLPWASLPSHSHLTFNDAYGHTSSSQDIER